MAKLIEELLDLEKFNLVKDNIRVFEQQETQQLVNTAQQQVDEQQILSAEMSGVPIDEVSDNVDLPPENQEGTGELP